MKVIIKTNYRILLKEMKNNDIDKPERKETMARVYVASSWSNEYQPQIVAF